MNKTTKTIIIALIVLVLIVLIYFLLPKKSGTNLKPGETTTTNVANLVPVNCANDSSCLSSNFLNCKPTEFKMDFTTPGSKYVITVFGEEAGKCHYSFKVLNADGTLMAGLDCKVPLTSISGDTFKHFFGQDTGSAKETQVQLEGTYCTALQS
ncbi:MAG: hypothetical protein GYA31_01590 [Parcubacteria group bacterium]|nr:hypothetical protein [Parcubacteria group bacterium]